MTDEDLKRSFERVVDETCQHFDVTFEELGRQLDVVAKGLAHLDRKLDRICAEICDGVRRGFANTQTTLNI